MCRSLVIAGCLFAVATAAGAVSVDMHRVSSDGVGEKIGTIQLNEEDGGLLATPKLKGLKPGQHGFHVHENGSCEPGEDEGEVKAAQAAGGHFDPKGTGSHKGPYGDGHLGDLPILYVRANGQAADPVLAPRPTLKDVGGRALIVHQGGDNYADEPKELGGGGPRVACGVIPKS